MFAKWLRFAFKCNCLRSANSFFCTAPESTFNLQILTLPDFPTLTIRRLKPIIVYSSLKVHFWIHVMGSDILWSIFDQFSADDVVSSRNYFFHHFCSKLNFEIKDSSHFGSLFTSLVYLHTLRNPILERQKLLLNML